MTLNIPVEAFFWIVPIALHFVWMLSFSSTSSNLGSDRGWMFAFTFFPLLFVCALMNLIYRWLT